MIVLTLVNILIPSCMGIAACLCSNYISLLYPVLSYISVSPYASSCSLLNIGGQYKAFDLSACLIYKLANISSFLYIVTSCFYIHPFNHVASSTLDHVTFIATYVACIPLAFLPLFSQLSLPLLTTMATLT